MLAAPAATEVAAVSFEQTASLALAETLNAVALTNNSVALSWPTDTTEQSYRLYSDMGSGYGLFIYKTQAMQPAHIDKFLKPDAIYRYRITKVAANQEQFLAQTAVSTFDRAPVASDSTTTTEFEVASVSALAAAVPTALPPNAVLLGLVSDNNFTDDFDTLTIVGEVRNDSNLTVGESDISVTFYDTSGNIIDTATGETLLQSIPPGEKSPFILSVKRPAGLNSHSLRAIAVPVAAEPGSQLSVREVRRFEDDAGFFHVKGTIENVGNTTAKRVNVAAAIYDRSNQVININFTYANPTNIRPGETAAYDIIFSYYPRYYAQHVIAFEE
jgi:hypothetical protein